MQYRKEIYPFSMLCFMQSPTQVKIKYEKGQINFLFRAKV